MPALAQYCKAYHLKDFKEYPGWEPRPVPDRDSTEPNGGNSDILFLHQDYTVASGIARDEGIVYECADSAWITFCRQELKFEIPVWCGQSAPQGK